jgi:hypothetical protein
VTTMTAKITEAASIANTAKNDEQEKIVKAGRAGPFRIRVGKSMHRLTASGKEIEMMIFWVVRVRVKSRRRYFGEGEDGCLGKACIVGRLNNP